MQTTPDSLSTFVRFIQLKSLRTRSQEQYVRWVRRIAKHSGVACASLLTEKQVLGFIHGLQQNPDSNYKGSTLNQCVCALRLLIQSPPPAPSPMQVASRQAATPRLVIEAVSRPVPVAPDSG